MPTQHNRFSRRSFFSTLGAAVAACVLKPLGKWHRQPKLYVVNMNGGLPSHFEDGRQLAAAAAEDYARRAMANPYRWGAGAKPPPEVWRGAEVSIASWRAQVNGVNMRFKSREEGEAALISIGKTPFSWGIA